VKTPETVAAIAEVDASGETAHIYAEIRETLGIVNLIWRHLATIDGALNWAWSALGPVYASGALVEPTDSLRRSAHSLLQPVERVPEEVLRSLGLSDNTCHAIIDIVDSYDRSNATNLIATTALLQRVAAMSSVADIADSTVPDTTTVKPTFKTLLPILAMTDLDASTAALVERLNGLCSTHDRPVLVSIYRHLGHWPAYLALAWTQIAPLAENGRLDDCSLKIDRLARDKSSQVAASLQPIGRHPAGERALSEFLERIGLPRMVAITAVHMQSLPFGDHAVATKQATS